MPYDNFMVHFESKEGCVGALSRGPWTIFGKCLILRKWTPKFKPRDAIKYVPSWVRIADLPLHLYQEKILLQAATGLGCPIRIDNRTVFIGRGKYARICIEVGLEKPLKGSISINGDRFLVEYEAISSICFGCGRVGHIKTHFHYTKAKQNQKKFKRRVPKRLIRRLLVRQESSTRWNRSWPAMRIFTVLGWRSLEGLGVNQIKIV